MEENQVKKGTFFDFDGVIEILKNRGVRKTKKAIGLEIGFSESGMQKLGKTSPKAITMLHHFLQDNCLKFEDVVKEVESKKE